MRLVSSIKQLQFRLRNQLTEVGFQKIERCEWNKSNYPELSGLETRKESILIVEAQKE